MDVQQRAAITPEPPENRLPAIFKAADLEARGIHRGRLFTLLRGDEVERVGRGLYRLTNLELSELETVATIAAAAPGAVICLLSALQFHNIGTQLPHEVWIAIDRKARKPRRLPARVRVVRFAGPLLTYGVETHSIHGVTVRITSPARTVVDCFRYRNKIGMDVALEALRDALGSHIATVAEIDRAAAACRARTVMRPYLEALAV